MKWTEPAAKGEVGRQCPLQLRSLFLCHKQLVIGDLFLNMRMKKSTLQLLSPPGGQDRYIFIYIHIIWNRTLLSTIIGGYKVTILLVAGEKNLFKNAQ